MSEEYDELADYFQFQDALRRCQKRSDSVPGVLWYSAVVYLRRWRRFKLGCRILWSVIWK